MGKLVMSNTDIRSPCYRNACTELAKQVPGRLYLHLNVVPSNLIQTWIRINMFKAMGTLTYGSETIKNGCPSLFAARRPPIFFHYRHHLVTNLHTVHYRPTRLNSRHIVDVLRAVCGPANVSEAELDRVKREATENAMDWEYGDNNKRWEGMWMTYWRGDVVITEV